ncbi:hypothetical protein D554_1980 [Bordetella holmesii 30539]|uniref:N-acetyltransferase YedL n=1 Tax=Bordetella holmesii 1058 TaxID=1247648 RepID=A0ABN0S0Z9_9BORD|nr:hypothetical protein D556_0726 [Bordetella holmesii 41130]EXF86731.1 hypothetical protein D554_1980 [Bordetella holmesii 30539]EXX95243.1 hypothetical protein D559_2674 [Bordetella holmesii 1058]
MGIRDGVDLRMHGGLHIRVVVAQAGNRRAARAVEIGAACVVVDPDARPPYRHGRRLAQGPVQYMGVAHDGMPQERL